MRGKREKWIQVGQTVARNLYTHCLPLILELRTTFAPWGWMLSDPFRRAENIYMKHKGSPNCAGLIGAISLCEAHLELCKDIGGMKEDMFDSRRASIDRQKVRAPVDGR